MDDASTSSPPEAPVQAQPSRNRRIAANILLVLFCVLAPIAGVAVWARSEVLNTDRYLETVDELAADPVIQEAAAQRTADAIFQRLDLGSRLAEALPGNQQILIGPATVAIEDWVTSEIERFFASDEWQRIWNEMNRVAHESLVAVLTGEGRGALQVEGGEVILDLTPLVETIEARLGERGLQVVDRVTGGEPVNTEIVLLDSPELAKARRATDLLNRLAIVLPIVDIAFLAGYLLLAPHRRKAAVRAGLGLAISMTFLLVLLTIGRSLYLSGVDLESRRRVAEVLFDTIVERVRTGSRILVVLGLLTAAVAYLLGFREKVRVPAVAGAGAWIAARRTVLSAAVVAAGCLLLILWDRPSTAAVGMIVLLATALLALIWLIDRQPAATPAPPATSGD